MKEHPQGWDLVWPSAFQAGEARRRGAARSTFALSISNTATRLAPWNRRPGTFRSGSKVPMHKTIYTKRRLMRCAARDAQVRPRVVQPARIYVRLDCRSSCRRVMSSRILMPCAVHTRWTTSCRKASSRVQRTSAWPIMAVCRIGSSSGSVTTAGETSGNSARAPAASRKTRYSKMAPLVRGHLI